MYCTRPYCRMRAVECVSDLLDLLEAVLYDTSAVDQPPEAAAAAAAAAAEAVAEALLQLAFEVMMGSAAAVAAGGGGGGGAAEVVAALVRLQELAPAAVCGRHTAALSLLMLSAHGKVRGWRGWGEEWGGDRACVQDGVWKMAWVKWMVCWEWDSGCVGCAGHVILLCAHGCVE